MYINIELGISHYSAEELIYYSNSGLLYAGSYCLSDLVDKISKDYKQKLSEIGTDSGSRRYDSGWEDAVDNMRHYLENMS